MIAHLINGLNGQMRGKPWNPVLYGTHKYPLSSNLQLEPSSVLTLLQLRPMTFKINKSQIIVNSING